MHDTTCPSDLRPHIVEETGQYDGIHMLKRSRYVDVPVHYACSTVPPTSPPAPDDPDDQEMQPGRIAHECKSRTTMSENSAR